MATVRAPQARALPWYQWVRPGALYFVGMIPAASTFYLGVTDQLGADPMKTLERTLGLWALRFLIVGLAITPLRQLAGVNLLRYRRAIGLLAFFYAVLHLTTYLVLDQGLDWHAIWMDIVKRPFITVGMTTFLILLVLAVTSNRFSKSKLGRKWGKLHRLVYVAAIGGTLHFWQLVKADTTEPWRWAAGFALLFAIRVWWGYRPRLAARAIPNSQRPIPNHSQLPTSKSPQR